MKYLDRPRMTKRPSNFTMGQKPPYEVLFQRFHHKAPNMSFGWYRCFICRDGKMLEGREVRTHVENNHTWEQVCD